MMAGDVRSDKSERKKRGLLLFFLFTFGVFFEKIYVSGRDVSGCELQWRKGIFAFS